MDEKAILEETFLMHLKNHTQGVNAITLLITWLTLIPGREEAESAGSSQRAEPRLDLLTTINKHLACAETTASVTGEMQNLQA